MAFELGQLPLDGSDVTLMVIREGLPILSTTSGRADQQPGEFLLVGFDLEGEPQEPPTLDSQPCARATLKASFLVANLDLAERFAGITKGDAVLTFRARKSDRRDLLVLNDSTLSWSIGAADPSSRVLWTLVAKSERVRFEREALVDTTAEAPAA